jgi:hypothetical protein
VGFTSVGSFTTTFRRHTGATPTAFRRRHRGPSPLDRIPMCFVMAWTRQLPDTALFEKTPGEPEARLATVGDREEERA